MRNIIIQIACIAIACVLYPFILVRDGFNWTTAVIGIEPMVMTAAIAPDIIKRCKS